MSTIVSNSTGGEVCTTAAVLQYDEMHLFFPLTMSVCLSV